MKNNSSVWNRLENGEKLLVFFACVLVFPVSSLLPFQCPKKDDDAQASKIVHASSGSQDEEDVATPEESEHQSLLQWKLC